MNSKTTPKDFFLHLATTAFLYTSVVALINLVFALINRAQPDVFQFYVGGVSDVVWPMAILIVLVPVTYALEYAIARDIKKIPAKREIWIRRWRIYLTLFLTGVTIVIDLVALLNAYLNGDLTSRFIEKVLVVLLVSAVVFSYYLLAKNAAPGTKTQRVVLMLVGVGICLAAIVYGFVIIGSPSNQRALRLDQQRISDLSSLQSQVAYYWQRAGKLPDSLSALNDPISNYAVPRDPETGQIYQYAVKGNLDFSLCATFDLPSPPHVGGLVIMDPFQHGAGTVCFDRFVDTKIYPPIPTPKPAM